MDTPPGPNPGLPRGPMQAFVRSFLFAGQGVWHAVRTQRNMRVHVAAAIAVAIAGAVLRIGAVQWACLALAIGIVLVAEMFNTVIEAMIDLQSPHRHPLAKIAKDGAPGPGLPASFAALPPPIALFLPRLLPSPAS